MPLIENASYTIQKKDGNSFMGCFILITTDTPMKLVFGKVPIKDILTWLETNTSDFINKYDTEHLEVCTVDQINSFTMTKQDTDLDEDFLTVKTTLLNRHPAQVHNDTDLNTTPNNSNQL